MPFPFSVVLAGAAVMVLAAGAFPWLDAYDSVATATPGNATTATPVLPETRFTNATHLAEVCLQQCAPGGVCEQDPYSAVTTCVVCGPGTSMDPATGRCLNTLECTTWPWCSTAEATPLSQAHAALALSVWVGPGANNFTYPVTNLSKALPYVPYLGATTAAVIASLNEYVLGRRTLGQGYGATPYFDDEAGTWGDNLAVYKSIVPSVWVNYVLHVKTRCCTRTWRALNGTCLPPALP